MNNASSILSRGVLAGVEGSSLEVNGLAICQGSPAFEARSFDSSEYASAQDQGAGDPPDVSRAPRAAERDMQLDEFAARFIWFYDVPLLWAKPQPLMLRSI